jgi:hypothetical protein
MCLVRGFKEVGSGRTQMNPRLDGSRCGLGCTREGIYRVEFFRKKEMFPTSAFAHSHYKILTTQSEK